MTDSPTTETETCGWLIQVPSNNPEPDSIEDCFVTIPCGEPVAPDARHCLCPDHHAALDLPASVFERISEMHDGRAWS